MSDKILSDGEMDALMEGMADGSVEVLREGGSDTRNVRPFEIRPQNHLRFGSYPALSRLNEGFAVLVQRYFRQALGWPASCDLKRQYEATVADVVNRFDGLQHIMGFRLDPLEGITCMAPNQALTTALVEVFFGSTAIPPVDPTIEEYSTGQKRTARRFAEHLMRLLTSAWTPVLELAAVFQDSWSQVERVPLGGTKDSVIVSDYQVVSEGFDGAFTVLTSSASLSPYLDRLDGAEQPGSAEQNRHWRATLEQHAYELPVTVSASNATTPVSLARMQGLKPGDELPIAAPNPVELRCGDFPLFAGTFGVTAKRRVARIDAAI